MKVSRSEKPPALTEDAWITCGTTHQIKVDGDDSWPKVEMGDKIKPGESPDEAFERISTYVTDKSIELAEKIAQKIQERSK